MKRRKKRRDKNLIPAIIIGVFALIIVLFLIYFKIFTGKVIVTCTDSDGGLIYSVKGTVITSRGSIYTDKCVSGYSNYNLREGYCSQYGQIFTGVYLCPNGCSNGACITTSSSSTGIFSSDEVLSLQLMSNHEDSEISVYIDLSKLTDLTSYTALGFYVRTENDIIYAPSGSGFGIGGSISTPLQSKIYSTSVANLNPNSVYKVCLNGNKGGVSTGDFDCTTITTQPQKQPVALVMRNYDLDSDVNALVTSWINKLKIANTNLILKEINLLSGTTTNQVYNILKQEYSNSNLKYAIFIGWDMPIPQMDSSFYGRIYTLQPYTSLSYDIANNNNGFVNPHNSLDEITVAVIRPNDGSKTEMVNYFNRLIQYYGGALNYNKKVLMADSMISADYNNAPSDYVNSQYSLSNIDWLDSITDYNDYTQGVSWQNNYKNYLENSYDFLIIEAHGAPDYHLPRSSSGQSGGITADFIRQANPKIKYILGISCNIGNLKSGYEANGFPSPMAAYVFSGGSLVGLGAEMPFWDINGQASKKIYNSIVSGKNIGDASRTYGFVVFGDPFIKELTSTPTPAPAPTCKTSTQSCTFDNYKQSNCCTTNLRCAPISVYSTAGAKTCKSCVGAGIKPIPANWNLCCSRNWQPISLSVKFSDWHKCT